MSCMLKILEGARVKKVTCFETRRSCICDADQQILKTCQFISSTYQVCEVTSLSLDHVLLWQESDLPVSRGAEI